jgi:hypothetical protein
MLRLFNKDERYTPIALDLDLEAGNLLRPLFRKYIEMGFPIREIEYIIERAVLDTSNIEILDWGIKAYKAKKEATKKESNSCL